MINDPVLETTALAEHAEAKPRAMFRRRSLTGLSLPQHLSAHALLLLLCIPALMPFVWMVSTSLKPETQIFGHGPLTLASLFPRPAVWSNYPKALSAVPVGVYLQNTLFLCICTVVGTVSSSSLVAYGFGRIEFKGKGILFLIMISTIAIPFQVTMVPIVGLMRDLHWYGTYLPLIAPAFCGAPFYIFLLTQFFRNLPGELAEAARIDGADEWRIYWQVMLPLSKPALATVALFQFLATWNDFVGPLLYINNPARYTLAYGLQQLLSTHGSEWASLMADSTVFVLPILVLFFFTQKMFVQGIATTGGKN